MSEVHLRIVIMMTAADLLTFEESNPGWSSNKEMRIRNQLGVTPARYVVLLERAAASREGQAADPVTAHRVTSFTPSRRRWASAETVGFPLDRGSRGARLPSVL